MRSKNLEDKIHNFKIMQIRHDKLVCEQHFEGKVHNEEELKFLEDYIKLVNEIEKELNPETEQDIKLAEYLKKVKDL